MEALHQTFDCPFLYTLQLTIPFLSVQAITKEKTALVIPNAIQVSTTHEKYGFSSLGNRDMTYNIVFKCWQNVLLEQVHEVHNNTAAIGLRATIR